MISCNSSVLLLSIVQLHWLQSSTLYWQVQCSCSHVVYYKRQCGQVVRLLYFNVVTLGSYPCSQATCWVCLLVMLSSSTWPCFFIAKSQLDILFIVLCTLAYKTHLLAQKFRIKLGMWLICDNIWKTRFQYSSSWWNAWLLSYNVRTNELSKHPCSLCCCM